MSTIFTVDENKFALHSRSFVVKIISDVVKDSRPATLIRGKNILLGKAQNNGGIKNAIKINSKFKVQNASWFEFHNSNQHKCDK